MLSRNNIFLLLILLYFALRIWNLTLLPIYNDEAIYLDWGWRETTVPGLLFYSLYDAKQPLLMWVFGISQKIFSDPLFAGRIVSVLCGLLTLLGIYAIGKKYFTKKTALLAGLLYIAIPIFSFFDRQALMESAIAAVGVWSGYFAIRFFELRTAKPAFMLGLILGIGYFIKSTALGFMAIFSLLALIDMVKNRQRQTLKNSFYALLGFLTITSLLLIQPQQWDPLQSTNRWVLTLGEVLKFPILHWLGNIMADTQITIFLASPLILLLSIAGIALARKKRPQIILAIWFLGTLAIQVIFARVIIQRYLVSFLPLITLFAASSMVFAISKKKALGITLAVLTIIFPFYFTVLQIQNPIAYFSLQTKMTIYSNQYDYVGGITSGYGITDAVNLLNKDIRNNRAVIGLEVNTGTPESAIFTYFHKNPKVTVAYLDERILGNNVLKYDCLDTGEPTYFISRGNQMGGLGKFFYTIAYLKNKYNNNVIGIHKLKTDCKGKVARLNQS